MSLRDHIKPIKIWLGKLFKMKALYTAWKTRLKSHILSKEKPVTIIMTQLKEDLYRRLHFVVIIGKMDKVEEKVLPVIYNKLLVMLWHAWLFNCVENEMKQRAV